MKQIKSIFDYLSKIEQYNKKSSYKIKTIIQMPSIEFLVFTTLQKVCQTV